MTENTYTDMNSKHAPKSKSFANLSENKQPSQNNDESLLKRGNTVFCQPNGVTSIYENSVTNNNLAYGDQTQNSQANNMYSYEVEYNNNTNQNYSEYYNQNGNIQ